MEYTIAALIMIIMLLTGIVIRQNAIIDEMHWQIVDLQKSLAAARDKEFY